MAADSIYFDTSYLVRIYLEDAGHESVRSLAGNHSQIASSMHGRTEVVAAFHRAFREKRLDAAGHQILQQQFMEEAANPLIYRWLPLTDNVYRQVDRVYLKSSSKLFLRAADALHLGCAAEYGFNTVYSHDRHFLAAASSFGLTAHDVISSV